MVGGVGSERWRPERLACSLSEFYHPQTDPADCAYISPRRRMRWTDIRWISQIMPKVITANTASMKK